MPSITSDKGGKISEDACAFLLDDVFDSVFSIDTDSCSTKTGADIIMVPGLCDGPSEIGDELCKRSFSVANKYSSSS